MGVKRMAKVRAKLDPSPTIKTITLPVRVAPVTVSLNKNILKALTEKAKTQKMKMKVKTSDKERLSIVWIKMTVLKVHLIVTIDPSLKILAIISC